MIKHVQMKYKQKGRKQMHTQNNKKIKEKTTLWKIWKRK